MKSACKATALILGTGPNGLGAIRSLSSENVIVDIIVNKVNDISLHSRLVRRKVVLKTSNHEEELLAHLSQWQEQEFVIIPCSDWYVDMLVRNKHLLPKQAKVILPNNDLSSQLIDKRDEVKLIAPYANLPKSIAHLPETPEALLQNLELPIIIKPRSNELNRIGKKNIQIYSEQALFEFYLQHQSVLDFCIAQEIIEGDDDNLWVCNCTFDRYGSLINHFTFQRLQLAPPHFGVTSYAISKPNEEIVTQVKKVGGALKYQGPAMFEFKYCDRRKSYFYIEVNPRLGLCNYFDTSCNKNNVYATYCAALSMPFTEAPQKQNIIFVSLFEDLYSRRKDGQSFVSIIKTYLKDLTKKHYFIYFTLRDPMPWLKMTINQIKTLMTSAQKKFGG